MVVSGAVEQYVKTAEGRIHYVKAGSGPPVFLFHPLGSSTWAWEPVMELLSEHFTCYNFDMLGHGLSDAPSRDFSMFDFARSIDHAMEEMNIPKAHIVGNSIGAVVAAELAAAFPSRVDRLVLLGCPARDLRTAKESIALAQNNYDENGNPKPRTRQDMINLTWYTDPKPEWVEKANQDWIKCGVWTYKIMEALLWYDIVPRLGLIQASATLILLGEYDRWRSDEDILRFNIRDASKLMLPGLAHNLQREDPETCVKVLLDFLK